MEKPDSKKVTITKAKIIDNAINRWAFWQKTDDDCHFVICEIEKLIKFYENKKGNSFHETEFLKELRKQHKAYIEKSYMAYAVKREIESEILETKPNYDLE